jgi:hypothetical protein
MNMTKQIEKQYSFPARVVLPSGRHMWFSNQYRYGSDGAPSVYMTHWYKHKAHAMRWHKTRAILAGDLANIRAA